MPEVRIAAEPRTEFGKGGARRTRRAGKLPAVLYGHGTDPRHISLPTRDFEHALRTEGANVLLDLQLAEGSELALPKSIQRDPVRGVIEHVDLILVRRGERITVEIAVQINGEIVSGGLLDQSLTTLSVSAEATNIPSGVEVSIDDLEIGDAIHAGQITLARRCRARRRPRPDSPAHRARPRPPRRWRPTSTPRPPAPPRARSRPRAKRWPRARPRLAKARKVRPPPRATPPRSNAPLGALASKDRDNAR